MKKGGIFEIALAVIVLVIALRMLRIAWRLGMIVLAPLAAIALLFIPLAFLWLIWRKK